MDRKDYQVVIIALLAVLLGGCNKPDEPAPLPSGTGGRKVLVVCEGSLGNGNSSLGLYLLDKDSAFTDVYKGANSQDLGDIFQSMTRIGDRYYLCVNNSDKVVAINRNTWLLEGIIPVPKPRYILPVSETKAYVSSLFSDKLYLINPHTLQQYGTITLPYKSAEGMTLHNGTAFVSCWDTSCTGLLPVNTTSDAVGTPVPLQAAAPQESLLDKEGKLWVLSGNVPKGTAAAFTRTDPATGLVLKRYKFVAGADPIRPVFNATKDTLYFIEVNYNGGTANNGIYRMSIAAASLPAQPLIPAQGFQYFWALGIQPGTGYIYVGDPKGFTQRGSVAIYRQDGYLVKTFGTGIGPGHFFFDE